MGGTYNSYYYVDTGVCSKGLGFELLKEGLAFSFPGCVGAKPTVCINESCKLGSSTSAILKACFGNQPDSETQAASNSSDPDRFEFLELAN